MHKHEVSKKSVFFTFFGIISFILVISGAYADFRLFIYHSEKEYIGLFLSLGAAIFGMIFVIFEVQEKYIMFLFSMMGSMCSIIYLAFWSPLIWDLSISIMYLILTIYSIYYWKNPSKKQINPTTNMIKTRALNNNERLFYSGIFFIGVSILSSIGIHFGKYQSQEEAITDAITTVIAIIGQWFLSKKIIETWYMWIVTNFISIFLYISIGSYTYSMKYLCYLIISFYGLASWRKNLKIIQNN